MDTLETLAGRIETTGDIRGVVRTMKALSAVSIRQYERASAAMHDYHRTVELGLQAVLAGHAGAMRTTPAPAGRRVAVVLGSDRGLCGRFNEAVARFADHDLRARAHAGEPPPLILAAGVRAADRLVALGRTPSIVETMPGGVDGLVRMSQAILIQLESWRTAEGAGTIRVYFNRRMAEGARSRPASRSLAPLSEAYLSQLAGRAWPARGPPMFTMDRKALFAELARELMFANLYRAGADSLASEHATRLAAMQAADRNIEERLADLEAAFSRMRQEAITSELLDLAAGYEAAQG
ncbi:F0F1 ATP synthase subunit gamma [Futiania mangrovi]|uniref:F0F1 ATP synthase subunit gamma n=1 Tax=Futiania mangrovi TaxID=2959716 RepID=A0A9J6PA87_9PROT|nr:F0F1 ATP synthase subunit gamma [Futiania mangrovii]MCP1335297.1 F0F1 ATP synthase subunit gamma [Futiania mangrovii]